MSTKPSSYRLGHAIKGAAAAFAPLAAIIVLHGDTAPGSMILPGSRSSATPASVEPASRDLAPTPGTKPEMLDAHVRQAGGDENWWQTVSAQIERGEYAATPTPHGLQAPNRAQNLRTTFGEHGIEIVPRTEKGVEPAWRFAWQTTGIGRPGGIEAVSPSSPSAAGARVVYQRDGWSEWYENTAKGLEQGFTIERRPDGEGNLRVAGNFQGALKPRTREDGAIDLIDGNGACPIRYAELQARDASGMELRAQLELADRELSIVVDDDGARYPLTIDPLMTSPAWTAESDQDGAQFGFSVATAGDVNGDGFSDVIVGAKNYSNGEIYEGRAFVYLGSATGLATAPAWVAEGDQTGAEFGISVATAGDVNGDGFSDVIVGVDGYSNGQLYEGRAYVYQGSASGPAAAPSWTAEGGHDYDIFGFSVATAGDVNGDGYSDVVISAPQYTNGQTEEGRAFVYLGSAAGLAPTSAWSTESDQTGAWFGFSVATAGDVNSDGYADVMVGSLAGRVFVYQGSATGLVTAPSWVTQGEDHFGYSVATAGDVNGDGFSDVMVGAETYSNGQLWAGRAFVYEGSPLGLAAAPAWTAEGDYNYEFFGLSVATAGDVNGDGYSDVIVGAYGYTNGQSFEGGAFVYLGSATGLGATPAWIGESDQFNAESGVSVATAGDVNGDGFSDVIVGAVNYDNGQTDEGRAFVYHGSGAGLATTATWTGVGHDYTIFGYSVAAAGDVNGDGYTDVIIGDSDYSNGDYLEGAAFVYQGSAAGVPTTPSWTAEGNQGIAHFGTSVATAGDVNGDGYSDVIVGAPFHSNVGFYAGRAYVYLGSDAGLAATPAWTAEGNQDFEYFGLSVATAGDVNGDGFSDVIVGEPYYDNGQTDEGRALVYQGSATGLAVTPTWIAEGDQAGVALGGSVATAGDVNGDGFSDVIVTVGSANGGRVLVFQGSATGLATSPAWNRDGDQSGSAFGNQVATAGDVNGDGYSDVIVGAYYYHNGETQEGRAYVYQGSASGLATTPAWMAESNESFSNFGSSVGTAGDVNGDGYSDVIVGALYYHNGQYHEGGAFVYQGSASGLATTPAWMKESDRQDANFGNSVATAGDVNGDGFSDVIVGASNIVQSERGHAYVYLGNEQLGGGMVPLAGAEGAAGDRIPRQVRTDDSAPIAVLGESDSPTGFRLKAVGRTPSGRARVRFQAEVKPAGVPFDGTGLLIGPAVDTGTPGGGGSSVLLSQLVGGLTPATLYHWRLRVRSDSPFFPGSPWLSLPDNAPTEPDLRTKEPLVGVAESSPSAAPSLRLAAAAPNPFASATRFAYTLPRAGRHRLAVFDVQGREVSLLADDVRAAGSYTGRWDGRDARGHALPSGVYFLRLESQGRVETQKLVIAR
jgi:hypothetical protein